MAFPLRRARSVTPSVLVAVVALLPVACGSEEGVTSYRVPKSPESTRKDAPAAAGEYRMLGLMVPADDPAWFFKFSGPADQVTKYEADFDKLIASVQLPPAAKLPQFVLPEGWKRGGGRPGFVPVAETLKTPDGALEVTITQSGGGVQANLDRWVGQVGLRPGPGDVAKYTRTIDTAGVKALRVDLRGPNNPATSRGPMMGGR